MILITSK